jgi:hypothetical protein
VHDGWVGLDFGGVTLVAIVCASRVASDRGVELPVGGGLQSGVTVDGRFRPYASSDGEIDVMVRTD